MAEEFGTTVLRVLRRARNLIDAGAYPGIIDAIGSMRGEASAPMRDLAYFALLETAMIGRGDPSLAALSGDAARGAGVQLIDATIARMSARLH